MTSLYNKFLENLILPVGDFALGTSFMTELRRWRKISRLSEEDLISLSNANLRKLLVFTTNHVPFYKKISGEYATDPADWLRNFPVVDKADYNNNIDSFLSLPRNKLIPNYSSGSSGVQGVVYMTKKEQSTTQAIQTICWEWSGYYPGKPILQTGMTPDRGAVKSLKDYFLRTRYYNAFGLDKTELSTILQRLSGLQSYHLGGYASSLYLLARTAIEEGISNVIFDAAISWGDKMFSSYRAEINKAFGCKVFDTYGSTEGTVIAAQKDLEYYYVISPHVYVEILDNKGQEVIDGEIGYVVVTRLDGFSMPLVRYKNGDLAIKLPRKKYPKNRDLNFPLLERIIGRETEIVRTTSGKYMIVHFFTGIFEHIPQIKQFKVIQRDLDSIEIEFIRSNGFNENVLKNAEKKIASYLNEKFPVYWKEVTDIPATKSGKPQMIQSFLKW